MAQYRRDGYSIVRGLLRPEEVAEIRDTFMATAKDGPVPGLSEMVRGSGASSTDADPLAFYPRMMHPHRHPELPVGPLALRYLLDARIEAVLRAVTGEEPLAAQTMFYFKPAGARGQDLHQDNFYLRVAPGTCHAAWIAIDDADEENGGMVLVPGSGDLDIACPEAADKTKFFTDHHVPVPKGLEEVPVTLKAGDVLFFNGSIIHGSYPNTSRDRFRRALINHYVPLSSAEVSRGYRPLLRFDGTEQEVADATGGGPCGMDGELARLH
jgi:ectoine hydroxylase-related dioxygenase (phytanoyl-CoA dioxygenase family)